MLYKIYWKRSKWIILFASLVIFASFAFSSRIIVYNWQDSRNFYQSEAFKKDFDSYPKNYVKDENKYRASKHQAAIRQKYSDRQLMVHSKNSPLYTTQTQIFNDSPSNVFYFQTNVQLGQAEKVVLFLLLGFAVFFLDLKLHFNQFLFGLGIKRSKIFWKKVLFYTGILFIVTLLSNYCALGIIGANIPDKYLDFTWTQFLYSGFSCTMSYLFIFIIGLLFGVGLGNLFFAPLSLVPLLFYFVFYQEKLSYLKEEWFDTWQLLPSFYGSHPMLIVFMILASLSLLALGCYSFNRTSLENSSEFLLVKKLRLPIYLLMIASSVYLGVGTSFLTLKTWQDLKVFVGITLFCTVIATVFVYFQTMLKWWQRYRENKW